MILRFVLDLNDYLLLVSSEFYIKNIYLFWFFIIHINLVNTIFFSVLIKSNK